MLLHRQKGAALVEFAIILPLILYILVGILQFGWLINTYITLVDATEVGARFFASQAGSATANTNTKNQIKTAAPSLKPLNFVITTYVGVNSCIDPNCGTALLAGQSGLSKVTVTYNNFTPLILSSLYLMPNTLSYSTLERVTPNQAN
jgi:Flp pilus assembly protein TadG